MTSVAVVGVGAIGGYAAAQLASAGNDVVLCARRPFDRLVVDTAARRLIVEGPALSDPADAEPVDWVVLATKAHQNAACEGWIRALCGPETRAVLVLQNGIEGAADLAPAAGAKDVPLVPTVVLFGAELLEPGHVRHHGASELIVPAAWGEAVDALATGSDLQITTATDFTTEAWRKLVLNCMSGPLCALTGRRLEVFALPGIAELSRAVGAEAAAVGRAAGAALDDDVADELLAVLQAQPPTMGGSMLYDRMAGRPTEHDAILGAVTRAGRAHGMPTPLCRALSALLDAV